MRVSWILLVVVCMGWLDHRALAVQEAPHEPTLADVLAGQDHVVVNLQGTFGKEITAIGMHNVLSHAERLGVAHVVIVIDSPGGWVLSGSAVANQLREFDRSFTYHAVIRKAISASIWVLVECDHLWYMDGGTAGAAVAYSMSADTGDTSVDAKTNSANAAELAARAESKGHSGLLIRAMVVPDVEAWTWIDADGERRIEPHKPADDDAVTELWHLDTQESILALTPRQMQLLGFARRIEPSDSEALSAASTFDANARFEHGARRAARLHQTLEAPSRQMSKKLGEIEVLLNRLPIAKKEATDADPRNITVFYYESGLLLTPGSQRAWREATDLCIRRWTQFQQILKGIKAAESTYFRALSRYNAARRRAHASLLWSPPEDLVPTNVVNDGDLDTDWRHAQEQISRLRERRNRYRADDPG